MSRATFNEVLDCIKASIIHTLSTQNLTNKHKKSPANSLLGSLASIIKICLGKYFL